jgi:altronate dehydratase
MKQGYQANMEMMKNVDIDALQDMKADMQDMMWECNQINDALNYDLEDEDYDEDIDAELADIENDLKLQGMLGPKTNQQALPSQGNKLGGLTN